MKAFISLVLCLFSLNLSESEKYNFMFDVKARIILKNLGKVLFLLQTTKQGGKYTLAGGHVERQEFAKAALIRECKEEVGITLYKKELELVHVLHKKNKQNNVITLYFETSSWTGLIENKEPKKFQRVAWFPLDKLPKNTSLTTRHVLEQYVLGNKYSDFRRS